MFESGEVVEAGGGTVAQRRAACDLADADLPAVDSLVTGLAEVRKALAQMQAIETAFLSTLAEIATARAGSGGDEAELAWRETAAEVAAVLRVSDRTAQARLGEASIVVSDFPQTYRAWTAGVIDRSRVRVITDAGWGFPALPRGPSMRAAWWIGRAR